MDNSFESTYHPYDGQFDVSSTNADRYTAWFTPPSFDLPEHETDPSKFKKRVIEIDKKNCLLTIYPYSVKTIIPMSSKYITLKSIIVEFDERYNSFELTSENIESFLDMVLPNALFTNYEYGLGFRKSYRPIIKMLEDIGIEEVKISKAEKTMVNGKSATISKADFEDMRSLLNSISQKSQRVTSKLKSEAVTNLFLSFINDSQYSDTLTTQELKDKLTGSNRHKYGGASKKERDDAIDVIKKNGKKILREQPQELFKLKNEIELVSLEVLISRFKEMLERNVSESNWQNLFNQNPFILQMIFGTPVVKVLDQPSVGGNTLSGKGDKIADFLMKNSKSFNSAIVEIKTPGSLLLNKKEYRRGVYAPSTELTGAFNQVLDQIYQFCRAIDYLKSSSREYALESYFVSGILVIGKTLKEADEQKSFELFRGNSKNVQVITFDELLEKLEKLYLFLQYDTPPEPPIPIDDDDLPF